MIHFTPIEPIVRILVPPEVRTESREVGLQRTRCTDYAAGMPENQRQFKDECHENRWGYVGEWAAGRWQRRPIIKYWTPGKGDPGYDFTILYAGIWMSVDVKAATGYPWFLPVRLESLGKPEAADIYLSAHATPEYVDFVGWAWKWDMQHGQLKIWDGEREQGNVSMIRFNGRCPRRSCGTYPIRDLHPGNHL